MNTRSTLPGRDGAAGAPYVARPIFVPATALGVREVSPWLTELLVGLGPAEARAALGRLELAVHEVCMNSVDHAGLRDDDCVEVSGQVDAEAIRVEVADDGEAFEADGVTEPVPGVPQERGYGLMIVRQLVDDLSYRRDRDRNVWALRLDRRSLTGEAR